MVQKVKFIIRLSKTFYNNNLSIATVLGTLSVLANLTSS